MAKESVRTRCEVTSGWAAVEYRVIFYLCLLGVFELNVGFSKHCSQVLLTLKV